MTRRRRRKTRQRKKAAQPLQHQGRRVHSGARTAESIAADATSTAGSRGGIAGHAFWATVSSWGTRATTLLVFAILSRLLSPDAIGVLAFAFVIYSQLTLLPSCFAEYLMWKRDATRAEESTVFWFQMLLALIAALALGLSGYRWGHDWIDHPDAAKIFAVFALQIPFTVAASIPEVLLRRGFAFRLTAMRTLAATVLGGIVGVTLALRGFGVWSLIWKQLVEQAFSIGFLFLAARWMPAFSFDRKSVRHALRYGSGVAGSWTIRSLTSRMDTVFIGPNLGSSVLGYYNVGQKPSGMLGELIHGVVTQVAYPHVAALAQDRKAITDLHRKLIHTTTLISAPAFAALGALAPQLVPLLFGAQWEQSSVILQIFCIAGLTPAIFADDFLMASGRVGSAFRLNVVYLISTTVLVYIGSRFGVLYVAGGIVLESFLTLPLGLALAGRVSDVRFKDLPRYVAPGLLCAAATFLAITAADSLVENPNRFLRLAVTSATGVASLLLTWQLVAPSFVRQVWRGAGKILRRR
jgi:O-antigen/teichoic acid export membrane protein